MAKEEMVKEFLELAESNEEIKAALKAAVDAKDPAAIAALAVEKGFDLTADDFPFPDVDLFSGKELDPQELEAVAGGSVVVTGPEWVADCSWYAAVACGLAAGSFLYI